MNDKHNITGSIMEQIEKEEITPKPRWEFLLKNYSMWALGGVALFVGAVATSSALFVVRNTDWIVRRDLNDGVLGHVLEITPVLWIVVLGAFVSLAMYQMRHTEKGYRYSLYIIVGNIAASVLLGVCMYLWGYGHVVDTYAGRIIPAYQAFEEKRELLWNQPENGLLAGVVLGTSTDGTYQVQDFSGETWNVVTSNISEIDMLILGMAHEVSLVGTQTDVGTFEACIIRPWDIRGVHDNFRENERRNMLNAGAMGPRGKNMRIDEGGPMLQAGERDMLRANFEQSTGPERLFGNEEIMKRMRDLGYSERNILDVRSIECEGVISPEQK